MDELSEPMVFASAVSDQVQTGAALEQVISTLRQQLGGPADLVLAFATPHHHDQFDQIQRRLGESLSPHVALGVTAAGVIGRRREVEQAAGLSVWAGRLPGVTLCPFSYEQLDPPAMLERPETLRQAIGEDGHPRAILMFADPFSTPMTNLLPAMGQAWPGVPVVGGMASGAAQPGGNRLLLNGQVMPEGAVGVAVSGDVRVDCTVSQGCRPVGKPCVITKAHRHIVYELAGRNAVIVLQETFQGLDKSDQQLIKSKGLMIGRVIDEYKERFGRGDFLIRHILMIDYESGYIAINDPQVRVGQTVQFHVHDKKTAQEDFQLMLEGQKLHGPAGGALLFSCNGRGRDFFCKPNADAHLVHEALGDVPLAGFFAAGELGPVGSDNFMHGHSASLIVFRSPAGDPDLND